MSLVGAGLPAMAALRALQASSFKLQEAGSCKNTVLLKHVSCRSWLASDSGFKGAASLKPQATRSRFLQNTVVLRQASVGAGLPAMAVLRARQATSFKLQEAGSYKIPWC
jgi:hypothetical protein